MGKILIAEDKLAYAQLLAEKLQQNGFAIAGIVRTCKAAVEAVKGNQPDLLLLDVRLADGCGLDVLSSVKVRALVMAGPVRPMPLTTAITRGAAGVLDLSSDTNVLGAVKTVLEGESYYSPALAPMMAQLLKAFLKDYALSRAELAVLNGIQRGMMQKQIALESGLGTSSIARAVSSLKKLMNIQESVSYEEFARAIKEKGLMESGSVSVVRSA